MSVLVLGLSGVGKTSICDCLSKKYMLSTLNLGRMVLSLSQPGITLTEEKRHIVESFIAEQYDLRKLLIDAHAIFYNNKEELEYGFDSTDMIKLHVSLILLIEVKPELIAMRRKHDMGLRPDRKQDDVHSIYLMERRQRDFVESLSNENHIPLYIVDNNSDNVADVIFKIENIIQVFV
jgi:adenylate kinase